MGEFRRIERPPIEEEMREKEKRNVIRELKDHLEGLLKEKDKEYRKKLGRGDYLNKN